MALSREEAGRILQERGYDLKALQKERSPKKPLIPRYAGIAGRGAAKAIGGTADLLALPSNVALLATGQEPLPSVSQTIGQGYDYLTGNQYQPQTLGEKSLDTAAEFIASGFGLKQAAATKASKFAQKFIAPKTLKDYMALGGAGAGLEVGRELYPNSPVAQIGASILGSKAPGAATSTAKTLSNPKTTLAELLKVNPSKVEAFKQGGLSPNLSNISDSRALGTTENVLRELPFIGAPIEKNIKSNLNKIEGLNKDISPKEAGNIGIKGFDRFRNEEKKIRNEFESEMERKIRPYHKVPINNTEKALLEIAPLFTSAGKKLLAETPRLKWLNTILDAAEEGVPSIANTSKQSAFDFGTRSVPFNDLRFFKQQIAKDKQTFLKFGSSDKRELTRLTSAIEKDINNAIEEFSPETAKSLQGYNERYGKLKDFEAKYYKPLVMEKIGDKHYKRASEHFYDDVYRNLRDNGEYAKQVFNTLGSGDKKTFANGIISTLGKNAQNDFKPSVLASNFKKLPPESQDILLSAYTTQEANNIRGIIDSIDAMKETADLANKSRTGIVNIGKDIAMTGAQVLGALAGTAYFPIEGTILLAGSLAASKYLFGNPKFINWLSSTKNIGTPKEYAQKISELEKIAKTTPEIATDVQKYLSEVKKLEASQEKSQSDELTSEQAGELLRQRGYNLETLEKIQP
jgi:hypothetical protein